MALMRLLSFLLRTVRSKGISFHLRIHGTRQGSFPVTGLYPQMDLGNRPTNTRHCGAPWKRPSVRRALWRGKARLAFERKKSGVGFNPRRLVFVFSRAAMAAVSSATSGRPPSTTIQEGVTVRSSAPSGAVRLEGAERVNPPSSDLITGGAKQSGVICPAVWAEVRADRTKPAVERQRDRERKRCVMLNWLRKTGLGPPP